MDYYCYQLTVLFLLILAFLQQAVVDALPTSLPRQTSCYLLDSALAPYCAHMPYNRTTGHSSPQEVLKQMVYFKPLVLSKCSSALTNFLCSAYTPACYDRRADQTPTVVRPCRQLCVQVRDECKDSLVAHGLVWPEHLSCHQYPDHDNESDTCFSSTDSAALLSSPKITATSTAVKAPRVSVSPTSSDSSEHCNSLQEVPMCKYLHYHNFSLPNHRGHQTASEALHELSLFKLFVDTKCSQAIAHFLCYYYTPPCDSHHTQPVPPCRELCEFSREECIPVLHQLGITWPGHMSCEKFPFKNSSSTHCSGPDDVTTLRIPSGLTTSPSPAVVAPNTAHTVNSWAFAAITVTILTCILLQYE